MTLNLKVNGQTLTMSESNPGMVEKTLNYVKCIFDFVSEEWKETIKTAYFRNEKTGETISQILKNNECMIPHEVLKDEGCVSFSVVGEKEDYRITSSSVSFFNHPTVYGGEPSNPTPTEYEQIIALSMETMEIAQQVRTDADNGKFNGATGAPGLQGPPGKDAVTDTELSVESNNAIANSTVAKEFTKVNNFFDSKVTVTELEKTYTGNAIGTSQVTYYGFATRIRRPEKISGIRMYTMVTTDAELTCQLLSADRSTVYAETKLNVAQSDVPFFVDFVFDGIDEITDENIYVAVKSDLKCITQAMTRSSNITDLVTADCMDTSGVNNNCFASGNSWSPVKSASNQYAFTLQFSILEIEEEHYAKIDLSEYEVAKMNYVYVSPTGSDETGDGTEDNPYATIYHANEMITDNSQLNRYTIKVANGTYTDLQERYAGDTETLGTFQGVRTKNYVYYEGNIENPAACVIEWDGSAGFELETYNNDQAVDKCPFHIIGSYAEGAMHTSVRGFKIIGKNLRYAMHCETAGYGYGVEYEVGNLILEWYGRPDVIDNTNEIPAIGTGSSPLEKAYFHDISIDFHSVKNDGTEYRFGFQNHDNANKYTNAMPAVIGGASYRFENINFNDSRFQLRSLSETPAETFDICEMKNCVRISLAQKMYVSPAVKCNWQADVKMCDITDNQF